MVYKRALITGTDLSNKAILIPKHQEFSSKKWYHSFDFAQDHGFTPALNPNKYGNGF